MSTKRSMLIHIGAPKCGSSALQYTLSQDPILNSPERPEHRYMSVLSGEGGLELLSGAALTRYAETTPFGYTSFPDFDPKQDPAPIAEAIMQAHRLGQEENFIPILSSEGWINAPGIFADILADMSYPRVDVVVFLRAPAEWLNSAYWQWGVWLEGSVADWLRQGGIRYDFGHQLKLWSRLPHVRLHVRMTHGDVLGQFTDATGVRLKKTGQRNTASPRSLIGVLRRNRVFRVDGHDSKTEFVFQRWCRVDLGPSLWAFDAEHMSELATQHMSELALLEPFVSASDIQALAHSPPHVPTTEDDFRVASELYTLHSALLQGVSRACAAAKRPAPDLPALPPQKERIIAIEDISAWDECICRALEALLAADAAARIMPNRIAAQIKARTRRLFNRMQKWTNG